MSLKVTFYGKAMKFKKIWTFKRKAKYFFSALVVLFILTQFIPSNDYTIEIKPVEATSTIMAVIVDEPKEISQYDKLMNYADIYGVDRKLVDYIVFGESTYDWSREGDYDKKGEPHAFGGWQIWPEFHPEVSVKCAKDFTCSTEWAMKKLAKGQSYLWTCGRDYYGKQNICNKK